MPDVPSSLQSWVSTIQSVVLTYDVFRFFIKSSGGWVKIQLIKSRAGSGWRKICLKEMNKMKNTPRLYVSEGKIAKCFIEARPQHGASTHGSLPGANKRITTAVHIIGVLWAKSELKKKIERQNKNGTGYKCMQLEFKHVHCTHTNSWAGWSVWQRSNTAW